MFIKKGNVLLITSLFTALISLIILGFISQSINNINMSHSDIYKEDLYSIDLDEEEVLRIFMNEINHMKPETENKRIISEDFYLNKNGSRIFFVKNKNSFYLEYKNTDASRKIKYKIMNGRVILIPLYNRIVPKINDYSEL